MPDKNVICLVIDRLRASALGAYGNTWYETPNLDRVASESLTLDHAIIDSQNLDPLYRAYWQGLHAQRPCEVAKGLPTLLDVLHQTGVRTTLVTDEPAITDHLIARNFTETVRVDATEIAQPANDIHETHLARLFAVAIDWLEQSATHHHDPFLLWIHARAMAGPWDAPQMLRDQLAEEDDPAPPAGTEVPCRMLADNFDPDELLGIQCAYAGQILVLDQCTGALLDQLRQNDLDDNTLLVLVGARGFPLGEHGRLGPVDQSLYGETVHVPWLARFPKGTAALLRTQSLVQPADLAATLADWLQINLPGQPRDGQSLLPLLSGAHFAIRDRVCIASDSVEKALRTPAWYLRTTEQQRSELFVKPDDRWEVNEVSALCPEVVDGLERALITLMEALQTDRPADLPPLDESLTSGPS